MVPKTLYENSKLLQHSEHEEIERKDSSPIDVDHQESDDEDDTEGIDEDGENIANSEESEDDDQSDLNLDSSDEEMDVNHEDMSDKVDDGDTTSSGSSGEEGRSEEEVESESETSSPEGEEEDSKPPKSKRRKVFQSSDVDEGKTVFVRYVCALPITVSNFLCDVYIQCCSPASIQECSLRLRGRGHCRTVQPVWRDRVLQASRQPGHGCA